MWIPTPKADLINNYILCEEIITEANIGWPDGYPGASGIVHPLPIDYAGLNTNELGIANLSLGTNFSTATEFDYVLKEEYKELVKSIYEHEGFYCGRYETSNMVDEDTNTDVNVVAGAIVGLENVEYIRMYAQQKKIFRK